MILQYSNKVIASRVYIITFCNDLVTTKIGETFCEDSGVCAKDCSDDEENGFECPEGTIFSLDTMTCLQRQWFLNCCFSKHFVFH